MSTLSGNRFFFIGIGGIGMSGLARYFRRRGALVAGYDKTPSELTNQLQSEGIEVQFNERVELIPQAFRDADASEVMVVRTPAVPVTSPLLKYWEERGARILKRAEVLGMVTRDKPTIAVAGTHGKTTVSTMLAHLLTAGKVPCNAFLGGISANYGTNVLLNDDANLNVVEADEYDRSFLQLCPAQSIITAMDPDHLDIYGTPQAMFEAYTAFAVQCDGPLLVHERIAKHFAHRTQVGSYSIGSQGEPRAENISVSDGRYHFDLIAEGHVLRGLTLGMPGRHNVENAIAASTMALRMGITPSCCGKAGIVPWCRSPFRDAHQQSAGGADRRLRPSPQGTGGLHRQRARIVPRPQGAGHLPAAPVQPHARPGPGLRQEPCGAG
ncbi:MAG: hypothetical protein IPJ85_01240 [Flavobacteriales bacterium]|nr:hypothetical protein [Flavobacteriales bacterium]